MAARATSLLPIPVRTTVRSPAQKKPTAAKSQVIPESKFCGNVGKSDTAYLLPSPLSRIDFKFVSLHKVWLFMNWLRRALQCYNDANQ
jgi:hypothetical protein